MAVVILKDVTKIFEKEVHAVRDFNIEISDSEIVALVVPSGCGKSTVLRMIAGLEEVTTGEIHIEDKLVNYVAPKERDIAIVFQNYTPYPHMNVLDNISFGLKLRKVESNEILEMMGNEIYLYLTIDYNNIIAKVPPDTKVEEGQ